MSKVSRDGQPELKRGPTPGSLKLLSEYQIRTTRVPAGAGGYDWVQFVNSRLSRGPITGRHDGRNTIIAQCRPKDAPELIEAVDSAVEYANQRLHHI